MEESANNADALKSKLLSNGHITPMAAESALWKHGLESNGGIANMVHPMKYKRRKISAVRDFPPGCGPFAAKIERKQKEASVAVVDSAVAVGKVGITEESIGGFTEAVESGLPETLNCSGQNELPRKGGADLLELSKNAKPKIAEFLDSSKQAELVGSSKASTPENAELLKGADEGILPDTSENFKCGQSDSLIPMDQTEVIQPLKSLESERAKLWSLNQLKLLVAAENGSQPEQLEHSTISGQMENVLVQSLLCESAKVLDPSQSSLPAIKAADEHPKKKYPPRRRISAIRDFPPGCGRGVPCIRKEESVKPIASSGSKAVDNEKAMGDDGPLSGTGRNINAEDVEGKLKGNSTKQICEENGDGDAIESKLEVVVTEEIGGEVEAKSVSNSNNFKAETREITNNIQDRAASGSKLKGEDIKEIYRKVYVRASHDVASGGKSKGDDTKEIFKKVHVRTIQETVSRSKSKGEDTVEVADRGQNRDGDSCEFSQPDTKFESASEKFDREITERVQIRAANENSSGAKLKEENVRGITENVLNRTPHESKLCQSDKPQSAVRNSDKEIGSPGGKASKELVGQSKDKNYKRKLMGEPKDENSVVNQSQGDDNVVFEFPTDRVIVLALMAEPNCPWRQGKRLVTSTKAGSSSGRNSQISASKKKNVSNLENSERTMASKKSPPAGKSASQNKRKAIVCYDNDSLPHDDEEDHESIPIGQELSLSVIPFGLPSSNDKSARNKVRETLRLFQAICRKLLQEEEMKSKELGRRIDLEASKLLKQKNKWINTGNVAILGTVPGVEAGDEFRYRVELSIVGLHRPFQSGIDYAKLRGTIVAASIVASGGYADEMDSSDILIYSGQGGNPVGADKQPEDQKLERGNLALKNSIDEKTPVRVIRGFKEPKGKDSQDAKGKTISTFVYDGLYLVQKYWQEKADNGCFVFKFQLRRIPGQPELALREVKKSKKTTAREGLCVADISQGKEKMPVCAINTIDDERPLPFNYITKMVYPSWYVRTPPRGCDCTSGCSDSEKCSCAGKNGGEIPFNHNGAIVEAKPLVYECGPSCKCPPSCHNRVSQYGIRFRLEIFKTESRGWGVRSLTSIPSGSFICEYTGELLQDKEAEQRTGNDEYLFDIGHNYNDHSLWDGLSNLIPDLQSSNLCEVVEDVGFTIDAALQGNVGRFINHSCSPNLYAQNVLYDHDDKRMPHIMFFAAENIPPLQELTYHYNYTIDQVRDSDGNIKKKNCYCGSHECTGRLY